MRKKIGEPPEGVAFPVWAWYMWENVRKKPDLRRERWGNGFQGDRFACMEIDISDEKVVLTDFDEWTKRSSSIQATFWELRKEQIRNVRFFEGASKRL